MNSCAYKLELPQSQWIVSSRDRWNIHSFSDATGGPLHSPNGKQMPAVRAVQGDCERVYLNCYAVILLSCITGNILQQDTTKMLQNRN